MRINKDKDFMKFSNESRHQNSPLVIPSISLSFRAINAHQLTPKIASGHSLPVMDNTIHKTGRRNIISYDKQDKRRPWPDYARPWWPVGGPSSDIKWSVYIACRHCYHSTLIDSSTHAKSDSGPHAKTLLLLETPY